MGLDGWKVNLREVSEAEDLEQANKRIRELEAKLAASVPRTDAEELAEALTLMVGGSVHGGAYDEGKAMAALANWQSKHEAEKPKSRKACDACIACCEECVRVCEREGCRCEGCRQSKHGVKR